MTRTLPLLTAVLALVVTACGSAADDPTVPGGPTTTDAASAATGDGGEVVMENISFQPEELTVSAGTSVTWTNQDGVAHTTTSDDTVWDSGALARDGTFSFTFDEPGTFEYFCSIHPGQMRATITVEG